LASDFVPAPEASPLTGPEPTRPARIALRALQLGAIATVLAVSTYVSFELDRFFVPKELALHATALVAGAFALSAIRRSPATRVDRLLAAYLALSALSALFATNRWLGVRGLFVSVSAVAIFWTARALREEGLASRLIAGLAAVVVLTAATSLLQAYGVRTDFFSINRAPGGTLGNRNFVAHVCTFGLPLLWFAALRARSARRWLGASAGVMIVIATLVLSRSRGAWLACGAVVLVLLGAMLLSPPLRRDGRSWRRLFGVIVFAGGGVGAALLLPNSLRWNSDNPYLESVRGVANYQKGSGHGRLIQYERSLLLAARHPLFGVGPGNWAVDYPAHAPAGDRSLSENELGMTTNPWPSSDWIAFITERGFAAAVLLALVFIRLALGGLRRLFGAVDAEEALAATALVAVIAGAVVAGAFDAVLLLALPSLVVWASLGALWTPEARRIDARARGRRSAVALIVIVATGIGAARSAAQLTAMDIYAMRSDRASLLRASRIDPGNYRVHLRLARGGRRAERCAHARAAHALFPSAEVTRQLSRGCGD
jgi:O-antigen ligase